MKTKFLKVLDSGTEIQFLLIQFQESEKEILKDCGKSINTKILLNLSDYPITCISGYDLSERHGNSVESLTKVMDPNGSINGLKEIVHRVPDITYLPERLNVKDARWAFNHTRFDEENDMTELLEQLYEDESYSSTLEKLLFRGKLNQVTIIVVQKNTGFIIYEETSFSADNKEFISTYLWIPVNEITDPNIIEFYENENDVLRVNFEVST